MNDVKEIQDFRKLSKRLRWSRIRTLVITVGVVLFLVGILSNCFPMQTMASYSMSPTIEMGERVLLFRYAYSFATPDRGDIVLSKTSTVYGEVYVLSRVVGIPGDKIEIGDGRLYINGVENEQYKGITAPIESSSFVVEEENYFLLGDNFANSYDSRYYGCVSASDICGKCVFHSRFLSSPFVQIDVSAATLEVE